MVECKSSSNFLKKNKKRKSWFLCSKPKASMPIPSGSLALKCVKTMKGGHWWKSVTKRNSSTITLPISKSLTKSKKKPKLKSTKLNSLKCSNRQNSWTQTLKCIKSPMIFWRIPDGEFWTKQTKKTPFKTTSTNYGTKKNRPKSRASKEIWII